MTLIKDILVACDSYRKELAKYIFELTETSCDISILLEDIVEHDENYIARLKIDCEILDLLHLNCKDASKRAQVKDLTCEYYNIICIIEPLYNARSAEIDYFGMQRDNKIDLKDQIEINTNEFKKRFKCYENNQEAKKETKVEDKKIVDVRSWFTKRISFLLDQLHHFFDFFMKRKLKDIDTSEKTNRNFDKERKIEINNIDEQVQKFEA